MHIIRSVGALSVTLLMYIIDYTFSALFSLLLGRKLAYRIAMLSASTISYVLLNFRNS